MHVACFEQISVHPSTQGRPAVIIIPGLGWASQRTHQRPGGSAGHVAAAKVRSPPQGNHFSYDSEKAGLAFSGFAHLPCRRQPVCAPLGPGTGRGAEGAVQGVGTDPVSEPASPG